MILAGIDEAGYGPLLGPMVVGCVAVEFSASSEPLPDGWAILRRCVSAKRDPTGRRLHVNDSKKVYSPSSGLGELERSVLALLAVAGDPPSDLAAVTAAIASESVADLLELPWYRPMPSERFPIACERTNVSITSNLARVEFASAKAGIAHCNAYVLSEATLNRMFDALRNKGATSFTFVARHIATLLDRFSDRDLVIVCDRQGGRSMYGGLLRQMFEDWSLEVLHESPERSEYRLLRTDRSARIVFAEKAESLAISVAMASMVSKYLREAFMARFNAYWQSHDPAIKPTAGYWTDGQRFLRDLEPTCRSLGVDVETLARRR